MLFKYSYGILFACFTSRISAVTTFNDDLMEGFLNEGGAGLAISYGPVWNFGQPKLPGYSPPCYPTWAFGGPTAALNDTYSRDYQTPGAPLCPYPDVGCECRNPGTPIGTEGGPFPIYYTYNRCSASEVRVIYNVYYEKDGASGTIDTGHPYDWESVIVVFYKSFWWTRFQRLWAPSRLLLGYHGKHYIDYWGRLLTVSTDDIANNRIIGNNKQANQDHPKVFPSWSKHAHFGGAYTSGPFDWLSQSTGRAFRNDDWWHFVARDNYVRADLSTSAGQLLNEVDWKGATSYPPRLHEQICSIKGIPPHDELFQIPENHDDPDS